MSIQNRAAARWCVALALCLAGCASDDDRRGREDSVTKTTPPATRPDAARSRVIEQSPEVVWQRLMQSIAAAKLQAMTNDPFNRQVLLAYNGAPMPYVDCGKVEAKQLTDSGEQLIEFPAAAAQRRYAIVNQGKRYQVERRMALAAQVFVRVLALSEKRTRVTLDSSYDLTRSQTVTSSSGKSRDFSDMVRFKPGSNGVFPNAATTCRATGRLEARIWRMVSKP